MSNWAIQLTVWGIISLQAGISLTYQNNQI